ncbi:MAG: reverse transcriptase N-terminal domain-containing protein [Xenococcus sp. MO_188.B8]|nr:reverse transcriptase N-terminal domain-containing protein [Xenococcus sp. MO_188.B8]
MSKTDFEMMRSHQKNTVEWNQINWRKVQKSVFKMQKRIYRAFSSGDEQKGRRLQKTLIKSYYNRLLSVRNDYEERSNLSDYSYGSKTSISSQLRRKTLLLSR